MPPDLSSAKMKADAPRQDGREGADVRAVAPACAFVRQDASSAAPGCISAGPRQAARQETPARGAGGRRIGGRRAWAMKAALAVVLPVAVLGAIEAGLRVAGCGHPTEFLVPAGDGRILAGNPFFARRFCPPPAVAMEPDVLSVAAEKSGGTVRIFILGESAAYGTPDPSFSFGRVLEAMLRERHPAVRWEIVNAAMMGVNSHAVRAIAADCAGRGGDLFVIYMGNNEMVGPFSPLIESPFLCRPLALVRARAWVRGTRLGQLVSEGAARVFGGAASEPQTLETFLASAVPPGDPRLEIVHAHFGANLEDILGCIRAAGARAVVATVAVNLADCAPLASLHGAGVGAKERDEVARLLAEEEAEETAGRYAAAEAACRRALAVDSRYADAHFRLGRCLAAQGRWAEAREAFAAARDLDGLPFRATGPLNEIIRRTAGGRTGEGVFLADAERALGECPESVGGIPGGKLFYEHVHLTPEGNYRLAAAVLPAVESALADRLGAARPAAPPPLERCEELLGLTVHDRLRLAAAMAALVAKPPFTNQSDHAWRVVLFEQVVARLTAMRVAAGPEGVAEAYRRALARWPDDWRLKFNFARERADTGDLRTAAEQWRAVVAAVPHHVEARVRLADALARLGMMEEAADNYADAIRRRPDCVRAYGGLAEVRLLQGRLAEAAAAAERVLALRPAPHWFRLRGDLEARQDRPDAAVKWYERGLRQFPDDALLLVGLGGARLARGEWQAAAEHFQAVLRTDPVHLAARCGLARALAAQGKGEEAREQYLLVLALNPQMPEAVRAVRAAVPGESADAVLETAKSSALQHER